LGRVSKCNKNRGEREALEGVARGGWGHTGREQVKRKHEASDFIKVLLSQGKGRAEKRGGLGVALIEVKSGRKGKAEDIPQPLGGGGGRGKRSKGHLTPGRPGKGNLII